MPQLPPAINKLSPGICVQHPDQKEKKNCPLQIFKRHYNPHEKKTEKLFDARRLSNQTIKTAFMCKICCSNLLKACCKLNF